MRKANTIKDSVKTRKVAILVAGGVDEASLKVAKVAIEAEGGVVEVIAPRLGFITSTSVKDKQIHVLFLIKQENLIIN